MRIIPRAFLVERWPWRRERRRGLGMAGAVLLLFPWSWGPPGETQAAEPAALGRGAVILMYHRFGEERYPSTNIRLEQFEAHLAELKSGGYRVLPLPEVVTALRTGKRLPRRTVVITIDDAYRSVYREAWPRLRAAGFPFTVFVASGGVNRGFRELMTWAQLRELAAAGVTLGNHTVSHGHLPDRSDERIAREIAGASRHIAEQTGITPSLFAYPYGEFSLRVRAVVETAGFEAAFGQHSGVAALGMHRLTLPRFALNERYGRLKRLRLILNALPLPVTGETPADSLVTPLKNPPRLGFTLVRGLGDGEVNCYVSGQPPVAMQRLDGLRWEGSPRRPFPPGRTRINCTLQAPGGRWRWYGRMFYRPGS